MALFGCADTATKKDIGVNINPKAKDKAPEVKKPAAVSPELAWLGETFGKYLDEDGLKGLMDKLPTMTAEEFEGTLKGLGTDEDKPSEDDIAKAMDIFNGWKAAEAEKAAKKAETAETTDAPE